MTVKKVTIVVDDETAAWARVYAAKHNMSVSRLVGEMLQAQGRAKRIRAGDARISRKAAVQVQTDR
jgi:hypothetical protein